jgi:hypothetical protein
MARNFIKTISSLDAAKQTASSLVGGEANQVAIALQKAMGDPVHAGVLRSALNAEQMPILSSEQETTATPAPTEAASVETEDEPTPTPEKVVSESAKEDEPKVTEAPVLDATAMAQQVYALIQQQQSADASSASEKEAAMQAQIAELKQQLEQTRSQAEAQEAQLSESQGAVNVLSELSKLVGNQFGTKSSESTEQPDTAKRGTGDMSNGSTAFNKLTSPTSESHGSIRDCLDIISSSTVNARYNSRNQLEANIDTRELQEFVRENRSAVIRDLDKSLSSHGFLQGPSGSGAVTSAATSAANVVGGFLPVLSALMRDNNRAGYIFHQFVTTRIDFSQGGGGSVVVPRAAYQPGPTDPDDRLLSGTGTYAAIENTSQNILTGTVPITIQEWGLGKNSGAAPIGIPTMISAYSAIDLLSILDRNLWQDYIRWEDLKARRLWDPTSRVVYNKANRPVTAPLDVLTGDNGACTHQFLQALSDYMYELEIPPLADGCYGYAAPTRHLTTIRENLDPKMQLTDPTPEAIEAITSYLKTSTGGYIDRVSGYKGKIGNMHVFSSNGWAKGAPGSDGVQNETLGASIGATPTYTGYAFGATTTARGIGREFNIRMDEQADFGRLDRVIWQEESGWAPLDVDPVGYSDASAVPQQLRVIEVRCTGQSF